MPVFADQNMLKFCLKPTRQEMLFLRSCDSELHAATLRGAERVNHERGIKRFGGPEYLSNIAKMHPVFFVLPF